MTLAKVFASYNMSGIQTHRISKKQTDITHLSQQSELQARRTPTMKQPINSQTDHKSIRYFGINDRKF